MSQRALNHILSWNLKPSTVAGAVLYDIAEQADDALIATTTASEIAERLNMKPSSVELIVFLAANQRRLSAVASGSRIVGWQLLDGDDAPAPVELRDLPYDEYLRTGHWQQLREHKLREVDYRCQVCNSADRLEVHHRTYIRRGAELLSDLTVLCADCHSLFHEHRKLAS